MSRTALYDKPDGWMTDLVTIPKSIAAYLVYQAFIHLHSMAQDPDSGLDEGCCREHCGYCSALYDLHEHPSGDMLTLALAGYCTDEDDWWVDGRVDWDALTTVWQRGGSACHGDWPEN